MPLVKGRLTFEPTLDEGLRPMIGSVMATSMDEADTFNLSQIGVEVAVQELYDVLIAHSVKLPHGWQVGKDSHGQAVGFVLPTLFKEERFWKDGRPQGTIFYMGVLPEFRGRGYGLELVAEATRLLMLAGCWRIFCDTGTDNLPMVRAFRKAGYVELKQWQRPLR